MTREVAGKRKRHDALSNESLYTNYSDIQTEQLIKNIGANYVNANSNVSDYQNGLKAFADVVFWSLDIGYEYGDFIESLSDGASNIWNDIFSTLNDLDPSVREMNVMAGGSIAEAGSTAQLVTVNQYIVTANNGGSSQTSAEENKQDSENRTVYFNIPNNNSPFNYLDGIAIIEYQETTFELNYICQLNDIEVAPSIYPVDPPGKLEQAVNNYADSNTPFEYAFPGFVAFGVLAVEATGVLSTTAICPPAALVGGAIIVGMLVGDYLNNRETVNAGIVSSAGVINSAAKDVPLALPQSQTLIEDNSQYFEGTYYRYTSWAEAEAIFDTEVLRGTRAISQYLFAPVDTFFTKDYYENAQEAKSRLALPNLPEVRIQFEIVNDVPIFGRVVGPDYGETGGGYEYFVPFNNPVQVIIIGIECLK